MDYTNIKNGSVIIVDTPNCNNAILIVNKIDDTGLYSYVEYDSVDNYLFFERDYKGGYYGLSFIKIHRFATDEEIEWLYEALGKYYTEEYNNGILFEYFDDSTYYEIFDYLLDVFNIEVDETLCTTSWYPSFVNEIQTYIWNKCCESVGMPNKYEEEPQEKMVSLDKVIKWLKNNTYKHVDDRNLTMMFNSTNEMIENFIKEMEE